jgi:hypothetical protein
MPNWKKLITSGSNATLNSLSIATSITASIISASSGITGSLFGTASWATNALTASNITPAITNNTNNAVLTATGGGTINGEPNLTFDGSTLSVSNTINTGFLTANNSITTDSLNATEFYTDLLTTGYDAYISRNITIGGDASVGSSNLLANTRLYVRGQGITSATTALKIENSSGTARLTILDDGTSAFNTNHLYVSSSGRVGIGTTTTTAKLHISGASADSLLQVSSPTNQNILFVSGSGNVGIGTTTTTAKLHISGASSDNLLRVGSPTNQNILFVSSSGRVGIGTINPTNTLEVSGSAKFGSGSVGFALGLGQVHAVDKTGAYITATQTTSSIVAFMGADSNGGIVGTYSNNNFIIRNNNTNRIILQESNVGIQTTPSDWIHLSTDPSNSQYLRVDAARTSAPPNTYEPGGSFSVDGITGNIENNYALGTPNYWMEIKLDENVVLIPCYSPA